MPEVHQDCNYWQGEGRTLRFECAGAATIARAWWVLATSRRTPRAQALLDLTQLDGSVQISVDGKDAIVSVVLDDTQMIVLQPGRLHHELWCEDETGEPRVLAEGAFNLIDSLAI